MIVVDNGSGDDSVAVAAGHPGARVISGHGNVGFGSAVNIGAAAAAADLLLVLNPDAIVVHVDLAEPARAGATPRSSGCGHAARGAQPGQHALFPAWGWRAELSWWMFAWFLLPRELAQPRPGPGAASRAGSTARRSWRGEPSSSPSAASTRASSCTSRTSTSAGPTASAGLPIGETGAVAVDHTHAQSSPRDEERMIAYALLGLVESAAKAGEGEPAAARVLALLRRIATAGRWLGRLPVLGPRARRRQRVPTPCGACSPTTLVAELAGGRYRRARHALQASSRRG